jgi:hypothetical protein
VAWADDDAIPVEDIVPLTQRTSAYSLSIVIEVNRIGLSDLKGE